MRAAAIESGPKAVHTFRRGVARTLSEVTTIVRRIAMFAGRGVAWAVIALAGLLAGFGWLYVLRGLGWFGLGPRVADSLPLLQLASFDGQPALRVLVAWVLAGALAGVALAGVRPRWRVILTGMLGLVILLVASQAAYALARNLPFWHVLFSRTPGFGPVLEAIAFAAGSALPGAVGQWERVRMRRPVAARLGGLGDLRLRGGEHRDAGQHDRDRDQVRGGGRRSDPQRLAEGEQPADQRDERGQPVHQ